MTDAALDEAARPSLPAIEGMKKEAAARPGSVTLDETEVAGHELDGLRWTWTSPGESVKLVVDHPSEFVEGPSESGGWLASMHGDSMFHSAVRLARVLEGRWPEVGTG